MAFPPLLCNYRPDSPQQQGSHYKCGYQHVCESEWECVRVSVRDGLRRTSSAGRACLWLTCDPGHPQRRFHYQKWSLGCELTDSVTHEGTDRKTTSVNTFTQRLLLALSQLQFISRLLYFYLLLKLVLDAGLTGLEGMNPYEPADSKCRTKTSMFYILFNFPFHRV